MGNLAHIYLFVTRVNNFCRSFAKLNCPLNCSAGLRPKAIPRLRFARGSIQNRERLMSFIDRSINVHLTPKLSKYQPIFSAKLKKITVQERPLDLLLITSCRT